MSSPEAPPVIIPPTGDCIGKQAEDTGVRLCASGSGLVPHHVWLLFDVTGLSSDDEDSGSSIDIADDMLDDDWASIAAAPPAKVEGVEKINCCRANTLSPLWAEGVVF